MIKTVLLIATFDTKEEEARYLKKCLEERGLRVLTMDTGILAPPSEVVDFGQDRVARRGGLPLAELLAEGNKGKCIKNMMTGAAGLCRELYEQGLFQGVIAIGGGQGTDIGCAAMRSLPIGVPSLMVSTVASGRATFGPFVGTRDITLMHSVADLQGLNFLTRRILKNAAGAIYGMVRSLTDSLMEPQGIPVAMSMQGTITPGALHCKSLLAGKGFEVVAFHQNGTGGIAMEDMIREGAFRGVLDLSLHEIADRFVGGLHGAIREDRLEAAGALGIPQVVAPGGINYVVLGPVEDLNAQWRARKLIVHNPNLTLVRLTPGELTEVGRIVAEKLNRARGPVHFFIPRRGFCFPDRENLPLWEPEGNQAFITAVKAGLDAQVKVYEIDAHINDPEFIDPLVATFLQLMTNLAQGASHV